MYCNITLIFSLPHYEDVSRAYIQGGDAHRLKRWHRSHHYFVSRVDTQVDKALDAIGYSKALASRGKIAIANAMYRR